jgi:putative endonuclease
LDIVAQDGKTMVFVEVKTRTGTVFGEPEDAITGLKRRRMAQIALDYLARHGLLERPCRFDVVCVAFREGQPVIDVYQNAFDV